MKKFFVALLMLVASFTMAQNGGQYFENGSVKLILKSTSSGYYADVISKQDCQSDFELANTGNNTSSQFGMPAGDHREIFLGTTLSGKIKARALTRCGNTDYGWVEVDMSVTPMRFVGNPNATYDVASQSFIIKITVADVANVKHIIIRASFDSGRTKQNIGLVWLDFNNPNTTYTYKIKKSDLLKYKNQAL